MNAFKKLCGELETIIQEAYEDGVTMEQAEKHAGRFLHAQMNVSFELKEAALDARMKKTSVKAVRAALYLEAKSSGEKMTEAALDHMLNSNPIITQEQDKLDEAEERTAELERYYNIFQQAHVYFRQISKGKFE